MNRQIIKRNLTTDLILPILKIQKSDRNIFIKYISSGSRKRKCGKLPQDFNLFHNYFSGLCQSRAVLQSYQINLSRQVRDIYGVQACLQIQVFDLSPY